MPNFFDKYPYTDFHELNLDWIIKTVKETVAEWAVTLTEWHNTQEEWQQLYDYVHDYFNNLDVQQEINNKLDQMALDGSLAAVAQPIIDAKVAELLPAEVSDQIGGVVAAQIDASVAGQIDASVASQIATPAATAAAAWLADHITNPSNPPIDTSLTVAGAAADAKVVGDTFDLALLMGSSFNDLTDCNIRDNGVHMFNVSATIANTPFSDWRDGGIWRLETWTSDTVTVQIFSAMAQGRRSAVRTYVGGWSSWTIWDRNKYTAYEFNSLADCNAATLNSEWIFNINTNGGSLANAPFTDWTDLSIWCLKSTVVDQFVFQEFYDFISPTHKRRAFRLYNIGTQTWDPWSIQAVPEEVAVIEVGAGKPYTTLRAGIAASYNQKSKVIVYPGTYDLETEFATELANHDYSQNLRLGYGNEYIFMPGSYVTCLLDGSDPQHETYFEPFVTDGSDFTVEGLNIDVSNTRYCVHDDPNGVGTYMHHYKNCRMKYTTTLTPHNYATCIGGGMGEHGYIDIEGGIYENNEAYPITYHNGPGSTCDGSIFVRDVYLKNGGMRFGYHGTSTLVTPVSVTNCSMQTAPVVVAEQPSDVNVNMALTAWNNEIR